MVLGGERRKDEGQVSLNVSISFRFPPGFCLPRLLPFPTSVFLSFSSGFCFPRLFLFPPGSRKRKQKRKRKRPFQERGPSPNQNAEVEGVPGPCFDVALSEKLVLLKGNAADYA